MIDLDKWFEGEYRISDPLVNDSDGSAESGENRIDDQS
jgi:endogenous inhibitor of DNA gyrase (YacG/DUF329 family)